MSPVMLSLKWIKKSFQCQNLFLLGMYVVLVLANSHVCMPNRLYRVQYTHLRTFRLIYCIILFISLFISSHLFLSPLFQSALLLLFIRASLLTSRLIFSHASLGTIFKENSWSLKRHSTCWVHLINPTFDRCTGIQTYLHSHLLMDLKLQNR